MLVGGGLPLGIDGQKVKAELRPRKYRSLVYALCNEQKTLVDSHVVPRFFLRAVTCEILEGKRTGQRETSVLSFGDKPQSRDVQAGSFERSHGLVQKLLCRECDSKIGRWESYARITLYGNSPGPDIRKQQLGESFAVQLGTQTRMQNTSAFCVRYRSITRSSNFSNFR
jgi:hypothetical protein